MFKLDSVFGELIDAQKDPFTGQYIIDRFKLQELFINYAIENNMVTDTNHNYTLKDQPFLYNKIGVLEFEPKEVYHHL